MHMTRILSFFALALTTACGGATVESRAPGPQPAKSAQVKVKKPKPVRVKLAAKRFGSSLRVDIIGLGRAVSEGEEFEDPDTWKIRAKLGNRELPRLVNGPVRIERNPVGDYYDELWDTTVRFSVAFELPESAEKVRVVVAPPENKPVQRVFPL